MINITRIQANSIATCSRKAKKLSRDFIIKGSSKCKPLVSQYSPHFVMYTVTCICEGLHTSKWQYNGLYVSIYPCIADSKRTNNESLQDNAVSRGKLMFKHDVHMVK